MTPSTETDEQVERRLQREARECYLGRILTGAVTTEQAANRDAQVARVEVTYQLHENGIERAGFFRVFMPYDCDPWETARDAVHTEAERRWSQVEYLDVDDIYAD